MLLGMEPALALYMVCLACTGGSSVFDKTCLTPRT
jgi:hypothetical protein